MNAVTVFFVTKGDCQHCTRVRSALTNVQRENECIEVVEIDLDSPLGHSLAAKHGILIVPALIVNGRLRLVGEVSEKAIRREIEKTRT